MNETLVPLFNFTLPIHIYIFFMILVCVFAYFVLTQFGIKTRNYVLRIRYLLPIYHSLLAVQIFTGLLLMASFDFMPSLSSTKMIVACVALIGLSAVGFKRLKRHAKAKTLSEFKKFALIKSGLDTILILIAGM